MMLSSGVIAIAYALLIGSFYYGFQKKKTLNVKELRIKTNFSILIAFRNEAENLPALLDSISKLNYPTTAFEIMFIDDHSQDDSVKIIKEFSNENVHLNIHILANKKTGKKNAISLGVNNTQFDWVVTTDADCELPTQWLNAYNSLTQTANYEFIAAPVAFNGNNSFLHQFQIIDFLSLQGSTMGSFSIGKPFMSNAANSAFYKPTFQKLNGFKGNENIASGDDVFLLEKMIQQNLSKIGFLNSEDAIVTTNPQNSWSALLNQRMRWAAKATAFKNSFGIFVGSVIFCFNAIIVILPFFSIKLALCLMILKILIDGFLIFASARFFSKKISPIQFIASSFYYPIFSIGIFISTLLFTFKWKGRTFKK